MDFIVLYFQKKMGENVELQEEELEVLKSIYEGDPLYRYFTACKGIVLYVKCTGFVLQVQILYLMYRYCYTYKGIVLHVQVFYCSIALHIHLQVLYCMYKCCIACTSIVLHLHCTGILLHLQVLYFMYIVHVMYFIYIVQVLCCMYTTGFVLYVHVLNTVYRYCFACTL